MKKISSIIALLLALALLSGVIVGCKKETGDDTDENQSVVDTTGGASDSEEELFRPDAVNFGGYDFTMMIRTNATTENNIALYKFEGERATQVTDVAIYKREMLMSETYGVNIKLIEEGDNSYTALGTYAKSGTHFADAVCIYGNHTLSAARYGYIYDINTLDHLNLEASYWDQRMINEFTIGDSLYCIDGDFNFMDDLVTFVTVYNDKLYSDYGYYEKYGTPYEMVSKGEWTLDKLEMMIKDLGADLNSDGKMNEDDMYGLIGEGTMPYYLFAASGIQTLKNKDGMLTLAIKDDSTWETVYGIFERTMGLCKSADILFPNRTGVIDSSDVWSAASDVFEYDRALFRTSALEGITRCVSMKSNYGILPLPKYNEAQEGYYGWVNAALHMPMSFPVTAQDIDKATHIAEILAYHSRYGTDTLYSSFYDLMATARLCRTVDDYNMLTLIFENKRYDLDRALQVSGFINLTYNMCVNDNYSTLYSDMYTARDTAEENLMKYVNDILENGVKKEG